MLAPKDTAEHLDVAAEMPRPSFRVSQIGGSTTQHTSRHHELRVAFRPPHPVAAAVVVVVAAARRCR